MVKKLHILTSTKICFYFVLDLADGDAWRFINTQNTIEAAVDLCSVTKIHHSFIFRARRGKEIAVLFWEKIGSQNNLEKRKSSLSFVAILWFVCFDCFFLIWCIVLRLPSNTVYFVIESIDSKMVSGTALWVVGCRTTSLRSRQTQKKQCQFDLFCR